jgi:hypothetical protein
VDDHWPNIGWKKKIQNNEKVHCTRVCFSPKNGTLFCFCCTLFNEQFTEFRNKCTNLAQQYSEDLKGLEMYQDYKDIIISLKRAKHNGESNNIDASCCECYMSVYHRLYTTNYSL